MTKDRRGTLLRLGLLGALALLAAAPALAEVEHEQSLYGRLSVTALLNEVEMTDGSPGTSEWTLRNNASRLGIRGTVAEVDSDYEMIYQLEYEVDPADGDPTSRQRNSLVGLKGNFGTVRAGHIDTPLKMAQLKADRFNDTAFDIRLLMPGEERRSNSVQYLSPKLLDGRLEFVVAALFKDGDDNPFAESSASVIWRDAGLSLALALDRRTNQDRTRLVVQYGKGNLNLALLLQDVDLAQEDPAVPVPSLDTASVFSLHYRLGAGALFAQIAESEQTGSDGSFQGVGFEVPINGGGAKWHSYYGSLEDATRGRQNDVLGTGLEVRF